MPQELAKEFEKEYDLDADVLKHNFYKVPNPNAFLATFAKFLINITQFEDCREIPVHFIGSIAYYLKEELEMVLNENGLTLGNVYRKPIDGLINYHTV